MLVDDPADRRLDGYRRLTDARYRARIERESEILVAEGELAARRLLSSPHEFRSLLVATPRAAALDGLIGAARAAGAPVYLAAPGVMAEVAGFDVHRGVLALGGRLPSLSPADLLGRAGIVVALEGINDAENMGAVLRTAAAFGAAGALLDPTCCDPWSRRAIRVSVGHGLHVPIARANSWPAPFAALRTGIDAGPVLVALTPDPGAMPLGEFVGRLGPQGPRTVVVLLGAEGPGLSAASLELSTVRVRIPMAAGVDSLNVGAAAAVALHRIAERLTV